jgi:crotonobetainyl-CoA:carnitine CoA-transferase CaiB-like acyl-CoA transferase
MATMILADYGAEVIRVESPAGDSGWDDPTYLLLNRSKRSVQLDLAAEDGRDAFRRLTSASDVLLETMGPCRAEEHGIGYPALSDLNPGLVYCSITGFGPTGPFAGVPADDGLAMAKAGILKDQDGWYQDGKRPVFRAPKDASYFAAMLAVQGILAALRARDITGRGQLVETDYLKALTCRQNPNVRWLLRDGEELPPDATAKTGQPQGDQHTLAHHQDPRQMNLIGMMVECKDGRWIIHSLTEPHFFPAWVGVIGFDWIWEDERFKGAPYRFPDPAAKEELIRAVQERMKERTADEWMAAYLENGNVCADIIQSTREALDHPQMLEAGYLAEFEDRRVGRIVGIGPLVKLAATPGAVISAAPVPGQQTDDVLASDLTPRSAHAKAVRLSNGPLEGITIVEAAYYYATPFATALLAELGARVIKIERLEGDPYRDLNGDPFAVQGGGAADPVRNLGQNNMVRAMQGKECLAVNLKDARGRQIVHRLIAEADAFVHSFRPGVPESLAIDYQTLKKLNPRLVYYYAASYGSAGPRWVFLAANTDDEFSRFCRVAGRQEVASDPRFASAAGRREHRAELEALLEAVFQERSAFDWESSLLEEGVGCVVADGMSHFAFLYRDAQAQANGLVVPTEHPSFGGRYWRYAPVLRFSGTPGRALPYCEKGEHTRAILAGLGFDEDEMKRLKDENVVTWPASEVATTVGSATRPGADQTRQADQRQGIATL